jgi:hypothetical protein
MYVFLPGEAEAICFGFFISLAFASLCASKN